MVLEDPKSGKGPDRDYKKIGLLAGVPTIMLAAVVLGLLAGQWADEKFGTEPYLTVVGVLLGLVSAAMETYKLIQKASDSEKDENVD